MLREEAGKIERTGWLRRGLFVLAGLLFLVPAIYVLTQVYFAMRSTYRTETAIRYTLADSITLNGVAVFESTPVEGGGNYGYLVADGERVTGGTQLAEIYASASQGIQRERLDRLERTISLLERSQAVTGDITQLSTQSRQAVYKLLDALDSGSYNSASTAGDDFVLAQNRIQLRTGQVSGFESLLATLQSEADNLRAQLAALPTLQASTNGYFISSASAANLTLDKAALEEMDPAGLHAFLSAGVPHSGQSTAGYIVSGFNWRFYATCTAEEAERLQGLKTLQVSVPGKQNTPLKVTVVTLKTDEESGYAKLVLECESINADVLTLGQENLRIDLHTYEGLRIDRAALHIVDGERGVYVDYGGIVRFRRITVLYENEKTLLVPLGGKVGSENEVLLYDEVIVEGNNLEDKKLL